MRIFVDMDGTLAKWNNVEFEQLFERGYYRNLEPSNDILIDVNRLIHEGKDVYILSCVLPESKYALEEKKEWLKEYVPDLPEDKYIFVPYGQNKADYLKKHYSPITNSDYLVDDYTKNLQEWKDYGGVGIKYLNGINHTRGTWKGLMVHEENGNIPTYASEIDLVSLLKQQLEVVKEERNEQGQLTYRKFSNGYSEKWKYNDRGWKKSEYDAQGREFFYETSRGFWIRREHDDQGREIYLENSYGDKAILRPV